MEYKIDNREEQMVKEISEGIVKLGFGFIPTDSEKEEIEKRRKKHNKIEKMKNSFLGVARTIFYTPLGIAFHAVSFVARGIGYISSFGLIAGAYYLYQSICAFTDGVAIGEIDIIRKAVAFIIVPFTAYTVSVIAEKLQNYFEENAF